MERLFRIRNVNRLNLLGKCELIDFIDHCQNSIAHLRRQLLEQQRENERLRQELGYGETGSFLFDVNEPKQSRKTRQRARKKQLASN